MVSSCTFSGQDSLQTGDQQTNQWALIFDAHVHYLKERGAVLRKHYHLRMKTIFATCLLGVILAGAACESADTSTGRSLQSAKSEKAQLREQRQVAELKKGIRFYRRATWHWQDLTMSPRTRSNFAENHVRGKEFLKWSAKLWRHRSLHARQLFMARPWTALVRATYEYRQCIIEVESKSSGLYRAHNPSSTAAGAYQFLTTTWQTELERFRQYFHRYLTSARTAIEASPAAQDAVAAFAIAKEKGGPWQECRGNPIPPLPPQPQRGMGL